MDCKIIDGQITEHFNVKEMQCKSGNHEVLLNIETLAHANRLEKFRVWYGRAFTPNSWYRTLAYNRTLGDSSDTSQHVLGLATDIPLPAEFKKYNKVRQNEFLNNIKNKWYELCKADGLSGGVGFYNTFFHLDSRLKIAFWDLRK